MAPVKRSAIAQSGKKKETFSVRKNATKTEQLKERISIKDLPKARGNIGARNPRVLAIRKLVHGNPDIDIHSLRELSLRDLMKKAFKLKSDTAYERMFDPKYGSPIYYGILHATMKLARSRPKLHREILPFLQRDPGGKTGELPPYCAGRSIAGDVSTSVHGHAFEYVNLTDKRNNGLEFNDPQQGCLANCYLIAALSSVAWAEWNGYGKKLARTVAGLQIPPSDKWPTKQPLATTQEFWLDQYGDLFYARLNPKRPQIPPEEKYEIWVPYYEKCFASFKQHELSPFVQNVAKPSYDGLSFGSTAWALKNITATPFNLENTVKYFGPVGGPDDVAGMIEKIRSNINPDSGLPGNGTLLVAKRPAIADTYGSAGVVPSIANQARYNSGNPVAYNSPGIPANHSFSILGLYQENNIMYVVLRNPWAIAGDPASFPLELQGCLARTVNALPTFAANANNIPDAGAEGIFGLDNLTFMRYFQTFYWAT
jgi:hypothetical protein